MDCSQLGHLISNVMQHSRFQRASGPLHSQDRAQNNILLDTNGMIWNKAKLRLESLLPAATRDSRNTVMFLQFAHLHMYSLHLSQVVFSDPPQ